MSRDACVKQVLETGIVAIVRSHDSQQLVEVARALVDGCLLYTSPSPRD